MGFLPESELFPLCLPSANDDAITNDVAFGNDVGSALCFGTNVYHSKTMKSQEIFSILLCFIENYILL